MEERGLSFNQVLALVTKWGGKSAMWPHAGSHCWLVVWTPFQYSALANSISEIYSSYVHAQVADTCPGSLTMPAWFINVTTVTFLEISFVGKQQFPSRAKPGYASGSQQFTGGTLPGWHWASLAPSSMCCSPDCLRKLCAFIPALMQHYRAYNAYLQYHAIKKAL